MSSVSRKIEAIAAAERGDTAAAAAAVPAAEKALSNDVLASRRRKPAPISYWTTGPKDAPGKTLLVYLGICLFALMVSEYTQYICCFV
jgi:hypothetical protein